MTNGLKAGVGVREITPHLGGQLFGYRPDVFSTKVNDPLTVTAIAVSSGSVQVLLVSASVCLIGNELSAMLRKTASAETGIPVQNIILSATHTHSGPNTCGAIGWGDIDRPYCDEIFIPNVLSAMREALESMRPALVGSASVWSRTGINRRQYGLDGTVRLGQNPQGPYDGNMTVVSFREPDGARIVNLVHYGAHGTCAGMNTEISRDWPGVMTDRLEAISGAPVAFFNGAEGDVGPRLSNGATTANLSMIYETGGIAAVDAASAFRNIRYFENAQLQVINSQIHLPLKERMPLEEAKRLLAAFETEKINLGGRTASYCRQVIASYENDLVPQKEKVLEQSLIALGDILFIPVAFEAFSEISLTLREHSKFRHTLCLGMTNGSEWYLPTQTELCLGGYEIDSFKTSSVWPLADDSDRNFIRENIRLMEEFKCIE